MAFAICKDCGYSMQNKEPGLYYCPQCEEKKKFYEFGFGCGCKPGELYEHHYEED